MTFFCAAQHSVKCCTLCSNGAWYLDSLSRYLPSEPMDQSPSSKLWLQWVMLIVIWTSWGLSIIKWQLCIC